MHCAGSPCAAQHDHPLPSRQNGIDLAPGMRQGTGADHGSDACLRAHCRREVFSQPGVGGTEQRHGAKEPARTCGKRNRSRLWRCLRLRIRRRECSDLPVQSLPRGNHAFGAAQYPALGGPHYGPPRGVLQPDFGRHADAVAALRNGSQGPKLFDLPVAHGRSTTFTHSSCLFLNIS